MQRAVNIFLVSGALATIGLTIPSVLVINHLIERPNYPRRGAHRLCTPHPHASASALIHAFTSGRTNMLQGVVHLLLFAAYILLIFQA